MKPIKEASLEERRIRALCAIECLTYFLENNSLTAEEFSSKVYMISHVALNECKNPHEDWLLEIEKVEKAGKELNIYNTEKYLDSCKLTQYESLLNKLREMVADLELRGEAEIPIFTPTCGETKNARELLREVEQKTNFGLSFLESWMSLALQHILDTKPFMGEL